MRERQGRIEQLAGTVASVAVAAFDRLRQPKTRVVIYDELARPTTLGPDSSGYAELCDVASRLVALADSKSSSEREQAAR